MSNLLEKIGKLADVLRMEGLAGVKRTFKYLSRKRREKQNYQKWVAREQRKFEANREFLIDSIDEFSHKPLMSIVMPVYNVDEKWLRVCIDSVINQIYPKWELCIADDASPSPHVKKVLEEYTQNDERIKVIFRPENGHISAASNSALELATGEWTVLLDHDDELAPDALYYVVKEINDHPQTQMVYSDEDLIDENGRRFEPKFKPDWSPDLFYSLNLITHLSAYRTDLLRKIGGFRTGFEGSQDYDLALRAIEQISESEIRHIPRILYYWRTLETSVALNPNAKSYAHERARNAIRESLERCGINAKVTESYPPLHRVIYDLPETVKVSVIFCGSKDLAEKFLKIAGHDNIELIATESEVTPSAADLNAAVKKATGEILVFVERGVTYVSDGWLREIASFAWQKNTGAVGVKTLYKNRSMHHGGIVLGLKGTVGFAYRGEPAWRLDSMMRAQVVNNFSAVSGVCMATRRELFDEVGGFDAENFSRGLHDVDYCLRLGERGYRIVWTPHAEIEKDTKTNTEAIVENPDAQEVINFQNKWSEKIERDPYYNPNLSLDSEDISVKIA